MFRVWSSVSDFVFGSGLVPVSVSHSIRNVGFEFGFRFQTFRCLILLLILDFVFRVWFRIVFSLSDFMFVVWFRFRISFPVFVSCFGLTFDFGFSFRIAIWGFVLDFDCGFRVSKISIRFRNVFSSSGVVFGF